MTVIDDLLASVDKPERTELQRIRDLVHDLVPDVEECQTYGMPGFKYKGKYLLAFNAFEDHLSLFPGAEPIDEFAQELSSFKTSKGTIQFTLDHTLTKTLLTKIIRSAKKRNEK